ncbi:DHA1 family purine base/nucleoside efflux pump-like MFS transporter [Ochrobactrum intermedium]|uniref:DHA1 family purine base/nucleoside efflux pump-like MFS transporter n=1 Tax=Brucella intermedia TaxID=94625 RepID=A0ABR6AMQ4_9HYPH|nr:MFS transporter [Brucella intermedia]KAB2710910.1 MFS transporter [Brucella intermedia]MBA8850725.1 DHA1 family purine base/nucleoside efflux pump-like MFS transporter [Brucella intermedia]NYD81908.1 DHA1 family purine base/nucleoside efflux pump-like MFS transporter [Brucella intermedia]
MDTRIFVLALATFVTGTAENIIVGILPGIARGLDVSVSAAGQLTSIFSITFALAAPLALVLTTRFERKAILVSALGVFIASNILASLSPDYGVLFAARIGMAMASAAVCLIATMLATELVTSAMRGRAIGIIFVGISGSMVAGVPTGMIVNEWLGWRAVFLCLASVAALVLLLSMHALSGAGRSQRGVPRYPPHLKSFRLVSAQLVSILMISGHFVLFAYLTPYLLEAVHVSSQRIIWAMLAFGLAGMTGGYLGGLLADKLSPRLAIVLTPLLYLTALMAIPVAINSSTVFGMVLMIWACLSWMISPVVQSFLMTTDPATSEAGVGINLSAMHVGVALGTATGGLALEYMSLQALPWTGSVLVGLSLLCALNASRSFPGRMASIDTSR